MWTLEQKQRFDITFDQIKALRFVSNNFHKPFFFHTSFCLLGLPWLRRGWLEACSWWSLWRWAWPCRWEGRALKRNERSGASWRLRYHFGSLLPLNQADPVYNPNPCILCTWRLVAWWRRKRACDWRVAGPSPSRWLVLLATNVSLLLCLFYTV